MKNPFRRLFTGRSATPPSSARPVTKETSLAPLPPLPPMPNSWFRPSRSKYRWSTSATKTHPAIRKAQTRAKNKMARKSRKKNRT